MKSPSILEKFNVKLRKNAKSESYCVLNSNLKLINKIYDIQRDHCLAVVPFSLTGFKTNFKPGKVVRKVSFILVLPGDLDSEDKD